MMVRTRWMMLGAAALGVSCGGPAGPVAVPASRMGLPRGWTQEVLFSVPADRSMGSRPSVLDANGEHILVSDLSFYAGEQPGLGIVRREADAWRVRFPNLNTICQLRNGILCGVSGCTTVTKEGLVVTTGATTNNADGRRSFVLRPEAPPTPTTIVPCGAPSAPSSTSRCPSFQTFAEKTDDKQIVEILHDGVQELHAIAIDAAKGREGALRYLRCVPSKDQEEVHELAARVDSAKLTAWNDAPLIAFTTRNAEGRNVIVARPGKSTTSAPEDARVPDALEACGRIHVGYGHPPAESFKDSKTACAVILRDERVRAQAIADVDKRCASGEGRACYLAGSLRSVFLHRARLTPNTDGAELSTEFLDAVDGADHQQGETQRQTEALFWRACELSDDDGCTHWLTQLKVPDAAREARKRGLCKRGNAYACDLEKLVLEH